MNEWRCLRNLGNDCNKVQVNPRPKGYHGYTMFQVLVFWRDRERSFPKKRLSSSAVHVCGIRNGHLTSSKGCAIGKDEVFLLRENVPFRRWC
eukprot:4041955-Amphidinium_carterae.1